MSTMQVFTIGFTQKSAETFFSLLRTKRLKRIVDVRLNNVSQLAGFTRRDHLAYFARELCKIDYVHILELSPTKDIRDAYKKDKDWQAYQKRFLKLLKERRVEEIISPATIDGGCLLCSEPLPDQCHRRLVAEYLQEHWDQPLTISHLL